MAERIYLFDTTLRDGAQTRGVDFSVDDKRAIARALDDLGVDYVEGGWPGANPVDDAFFETSPGMKTARFTAFGMTRRADHSAGNDPGINAILSTAADSACMVGKTWDFHVDLALGIPREDNVTMIGESIAYACTRKDEVLFDAEHFFDGFKSDAGYALATLEMAIQGGADRVILCDTNGGALPHEIDAAITAAKSHLPSLVLGIHVHNDGGLAVANTLRAVEAGVKQIQGTINGIGERCGNVDLTTVIANLELKYGYHCLPQGGLEGLTQISKAVWEALAQDGPLGQPYVGTSAFAHKGGVHVSAVQRNPDTYEHVAPEQVGNSRKILISELSGGSNVRAKLSNRYPELEGKSSAQAILEDIQNKEHQGYSFENADGSFDLLVRRHLGHFQPCFEPIYYRIYSPINETASDQNDVTIAGAIEASVKVQVNQKENLCAAEGNGPVDALNQALRMTLIEAYPEVKELHLTDYTVRVINSTEETAAKVRVYLEHRFQGSTFGTVGVNVDVIKASWNALIEAYHYALMQHRDFQTERSVD